MNQIFFYNVMSVMYVMYIMYVMCVMLYVMSVIVSDILFNLKIDYIFLKLIIVKYG